jgi:hypothetical protein
MVEIPKFYHKFSSTGTEYTWSISNKPVAGYTLHPAFVKDGVEVDRRYISAYDSCVYDVSSSTYISGYGVNDNSGNVDLTAVTGDQLASVSGVRCMPGLNRAEFRTLASNRGAGWRQLDWALWSAIQILFIVEYQTLNSQAATGEGNTNTAGSYGNSYAGESNGFGNGSTDATSGSASNSPPFMTYRGIENLYGNVWTFVDGVLYNPDGSVSADSAEWYFTNNSANFSDTSKTGMLLLSTSGTTGADWMTGMSANSTATSNGFVIPTAVSAGGSSTTYFGDQVYMSTSADRVLCVGGTYSVAPCGIFAIDGGNDGDFRYASIGARLAR